MKGESSKFVKIFGFQGGALDGKIGRGEIEGILEGKGARIIYGQITLAIDDRSIDEGEITSANGENHEDGKGKSFVERFFSY